MRKGGSLVALLLLCAGAPAQSSRVVADRVAAAHAKGDKAEVARIVRKYHDPWRLAENLCRTGRFDAAVACAQAVPADKKLAAYVDAQRGAPAKSLAFEKISRAFDLLNRKDFAGVHRHLKDVPPTETVSYVTVVGLRAFASEDAGRFKEAEAAHAEVATRAERLGWLARASAALRTAAQMARQRNASALPYLRRAAAIAKARGNVNLELRIGVDLGRQLGLEGSGRKRTPPSTTFANSRSGSATRSLLRSPTSPRAARSHR